jgi:hypothetical protein
LRSPVEKHFQDGKVRQSQTHSRDAARGILLYGLRSFPQNKPDMNG